jgi:hypothetical protein
MAFAQQKSITITGLAAGFLRRQKYKARPFQEKLTIKRSMIHIAMAFGISLAYLPGLILAQDTKIPSAETNLAPAAASVEIAPEAIGNEVITAWTGKKAPSVPDSIWYYRGPGGSQQSISGTSSYYAPALASNGETLYLAWTSTSSIYYMTSSDWGTAIGPVCADCPGAISAPALAVSGSNLYLAWLTLNTGSGYGIEFAYNAGSGWQVENPKIPFGAVGGTAPALAVYGNTVFLAWLAPGSPQMINYATRPVSGGPWSSVGTVSGTEGSAGPALGVYGGGGSLYLAWTYPGGGTISYSEWNTTSRNWGTSVSVTGLSSPVGPLTPALVSNFTLRGCPIGFAFDYTFSVVYASPVYSAPFHLEYYDLYMHTLFNNPGSCL